MSIVKNENTITKAFYGSKPIYMFGNEGGSYEQGFEDGVAEQKSKLTSITITGNGRYRNENGYNDVVVSTPYFEFDNGYEFYANFYDKMVETNDYINFNIAQELNSRETTYGILGTFNYWYDCPKIVLNIGIPSNTKHLDNVLGTMSYYQLYDKIMAVYVAYDAYQIETTTDAFRNCEFSLLYVDRLGQSFTSEQNFVLPTYTELEGEYKYTDEQIKTMQLEMIDRLYDFSQGPNKYKTGKSTLVIQKNTKGFGDDVIAHATAKGWLIMKES